MPSTRQTRHKLRTSVIQARYTIEETSLKRRARYAIKDLFNNGVHLTDNDGEYIYLSRSVALKYANNCNILSGLINVYKDDINSKDDITSLVKNSILNEWKTYTDAVLSIMNDRPNQHSMIISIVDYHIEL